ncbi:406_t:CDS:1, partial [Racocetra fulgida]
EDVSIYTIDEIDFDTMDNINVFDEEISEVEESEQIKSSATTNNLVERIKKIMSKLFTKYYG